MSMYVAFLRGVNVGGVQVKMAELKKTFESAGFSNVETLLASGNVLFESEKKNTLEIRREIEGFLKKKWKRAILVVVHTIDEIKKLDASKPFKGIKVTPQTRLYVTFLLDKPRNHIKLPSSKFFRITKTSDIAVCAAMILAPNRGSLDLLGALGKHYGKNITTRNWNTVQKILDAMI